MTTEQLRARYLSYLEQNYNLANWRSSLATGGAFVVIGVGLLLLCFFIGNWGPASAGTILTLVGIYRIRPYFAVRAKAQRFLRVAKHGVPVRTLVVWANDNIHSPGPGVGFFCMVVFAFEEFPGYFEALDKVAKKIHALHAETPDDPALRKLVADLNLDTQDTQIYRRVKLPTSLTDGRDGIYAADLELWRVRLKQKYLDRRVLYCLAEPGDAGGLDLIPDFILEEAERMQEREEETAFAQRERRPIGFRVDDGSTR